MGLSEPRPSGSADKSAARWLRLGCSLQLDRHFADLAGELVVAFLVVVGHRRAAVLAHVGRLVGREGDGLRRSIRPSATFLPLTKIVPVPPVPGLPPS